MGTYHSIFLLYGFLMMKAITHARSTPPPPPPLCIVFSFFFVVLCSSCICHVSLVLYLFQVTKYNSWRLKSEIRSVLLLRNHVAMCFTLKACINLITPEMQLLAENHFHRAVVPDARSSQLIQTSTLLHGNVSSKSDNNATVSKDNKRFSFS